MGEGAVLRLERQRPGAALVLELGAADVPPQIFGRQLFARTRGLRGFIETFKLSVSVRGISKRRSGWLAG